MAFKHYLISLIEYLISDS